MSGRESGHLCHEQFRADAICARDEQRVDVAGTGHAAGMRMRYRSAGLEAVAPQLRNEMATPTRKLHQ